MKYIAKKVDASVNLPDSHPLADLAWMAGGLAVIMAVLFLSGGLIVDQLAKRGQLDGDVGEVRAVAEIGDQRVELIVVALDVSFGSDVLAQHVAGGEQAVLRMHVRLECRQHCGQGGSTCTSSCWGRCYFLPA